MATESEEISAAERSFLPGISEDIRAVLIAFVLVAGVLTWTLAVPGFKFVSPVYQWANAGDLFGKVLHFDNLLLLAGIGVVFAASFITAGRIDGAPVYTRLAGFGAVFALAIVSLVMAGNKGISQYGIEYVVFSLLLGLSWSNVTRLPVWIAPALRSEFFIKTGLVILGTSVLFTDILQAGIPGILQAVAVVGVVWFFSLWLSRRLKVDDEFGVILASAVSICGVSAAIVAAGAIQGDKKKLSYVTTLVLLVAVPMLILQPWIIKVLNIPELVGGAWLGGTLDTTASVTAAAQLVGPIAVKAGAIVKFSQNVLIGVAAFLIAGWWNLRKNNAPGTETPRPGIGVVWERFPKFVLGFIAASLIFSFLIPGETVRQVSGFLNGLRTLWFALAFVSIGLEARFIDLAATQEGRPALVFLGAQFFNVFWTLLWSYLLFGGILFAAPDIN